MKLVPLDIEHLTSRPWKIGRARAQPEPRATKMPIIESLSKAWILHPCQYRSSLEPCPPFTLGSETAVLYAGNRDRLRGVGAKWPRRTPMDTRASAVSEGSFWRIAVSQDRKRLAYNAHGRRGELFVRCVFDLGTGRKTKAFAADAVHLWIVNPGQLRINELEL